MNYKRLLHENLTRVWRNQQRCHKALLESYYSGEEDMQNDSAEGFEPTVTDEPEQVPAPTNAESVEAPQEEGGSAESIMAEIRQLALKGLGVMADNIDSPEYDFFKKVWLACDKAQEPEGENGEE